MNYEELDETEAAYVAKLVANSLKAKIEKLKEKKEEVKNVEFEKMVLEEHISNFIKQDLCCSPLNVFGKPASNMLARAHTWANYYNGNRFVKLPSKEDKEKCEKDAKYVLDLIAEKILKNDKDFEFAGMKQFRDGEFYYLEYKYKGEILQIQIPNFEMAGKDYDEFVAPYHVGYKIGKISYVFICAETDYRNVHDKIVEWYNKKNEEK